MLVVDNVYRSFGAVKAVRGVSFSCAPGTVFGLLGPNGAGKTTMMRMILGIYPPDSGSVTWNGRSIDRRLRKRFGYLPEERGLYGKMKVRDQIVYFGRLHGLDEFDAGARTSKWLKTLAIEEYASRPCSELSKGNQQKVQLACAVLHEPELLVLDEPFAGLDPINADVMLDCIRTLSAQGTTFVLSSHQMWQIEHACNTFCIIVGGEVRASGTLAELRSTFPTRTVRVAPDLPEIRTFFRERFGAPQASKDGEGGLRYELPASTDFGRLLREAAVGVPIDTFERVEPSLNQIYVRTLGGASDATAA